MEFALELVLAGAIFQRGLHRKFPFFFTYLILELVRTCMLAAIRPHHPPYFYAYWISEAVVSMFGFLVVDEIFQNAFSKHLGLQRLGTRIFRYSIVLLILLSVIVAALSPGKDVDKLISAILVIKRTQSFVRCGLVVALFFWVTLLGLSWNDYVIGITVGFAIYGVSELSILIVRTHYGSVANNLYAWSMMGVNLCQKLIWAAYLIPSPGTPLVEAQRDPEHLEAVVAEVRKMNEALETLLGH